jgi:hypothetical protein
MGGAASYDAIKQQPTNPLRVFAQNFGQKKNIKTFMRSIPFGVGVPLSRTSCVSDNAESPLTTERPDKMIWNRLLYYCLRSKDDITT